MKRISLVLIALVLSSCAKHGNPVSAPQAPVELDIARYSSSLASGYFKVWSDSSWERYAGTDTVYGIMYYTEMMSDSTVYYYAPSALYPTFLLYSGFRAAGDSLVIFDVPMKPLPDTMQLGKVYTSTTTFFYRGYDYTLTFNQSALDTMTLSVPVGTFQRCVRMYRESILTAGGQTQIQRVGYWLAEGPAAIKEILNSGATIVMVRGSVNGQTWSPYSSARRLPTPKNRLSQSPQIQVGAIAIHGMPFAPISIQ